MNVTRRWFLAGATSFGALAGCRFFESNAFRGRGKPNLTFGVLSDIHISTAAKAGESIYDAHNDLTFRRALAWYRDQGVDAVMIAGDMADKGMVEELQVVAKAWYDTFPNDRAPDGLSVEKLFVYGNHDYHGYLYDNHAAKLYPDEAERARHVLRADMAGWWRKLFHEDYAPLYRKEVKGYTFIGLHWDDGTGLETGYGKCPSGAELEGYLAANAKTIDTTKPFFYFQHPHPKDTCYGAQAWGHDEGFVTRALSKFPNAIAFSGHSHYSLTDEHSIWQGSFTSIGTSSLRYGCLPDDDVPPRGYENAESEVAEAKPFNALKLTPKYDGGGFCPDCRQGMLCRVYDDCIVIQRRDFLSEEDVGADWVFPLPVADSKPFAFAQHAKTIGAPEFPEGAKLSIRNCRATNRGAKATGNRAAVESVEQPAFELTIPAAIASAANRVWRFEITITPEKGGDSVTRYVLAEGFNKSVTTPRAQSVTKCILACADMPKGDLICRVTPVNCFARPGHSIELRIKN